MPLAASCLVPSKQPARVVHLLENSSTGLAGTVIKEEIVDVLLKKIDR